VGSCGWCNELLGSIKYREFPEKHDQPSTSQERLLHGVS